MTDRYYATGSPIMLIPVLKIELGNLAFLPRARPKWAPFSKEFEVLHLLPALN